MWWNFLNSFDFKRGLALLTALAFFIFAIIGFVTVIIWIF